MFKGSWLHGSQGKGSPAAYSAATVENAMDGYDDESLSARAVQAAVGGCAIGAIFSLPTWIRARTWRPPRSVIREVLEFGALSSASEVVEATVERVRGRKEDLVAPIVGIVVPRVASVTLFTLLSNKRYQNDVRTGKVAEERASATREAAAKEEAAREAAALDEWYPSEQFRWKAFGRNLLGTVALPVLNTVTFHVLSKPLAVTKARPPKKIAPRWL